MFLPDFPAPGEEIKRIRSVTEEVRQNPSSDSFAVHRCWYDSLTSNGATAALEHNEAAVPVRECRQSRPERSIDRQTP
jgi:hypothetical protein